MVYIRAFLVWLIIMAVETCHGIARTLFIAPLTGDFRARQIGVFIGALLFFYYDTFYKIYKYIKKINAINNRLWVGFIYTFF